MRATIRWQSRPTGLARPWPSAAARLAGTHSPGSGRTSSPPGLRSSSSRARATARGDTADDGADVPVPSAEPPLTRAVLNFAVIIRGNDLDMTSIELGLQTVGLPLWIAGHTEAPTVGASERPPPARLTVRPVSPLACPSNPRRAGSSTPRCCTPSSARTTRPAGSSTRCCRSGAPASSSRPTTSGSSGCWSATAPTSRASWKRSSGRSSPTTPTAARHWSRPWTPTPAALPPPGSTRRS